VITSNIVIRRPRMEELNRIDAFFAIVIEHTFLVNGLGALADTKAEELDYKQKIIRADFATGGEERFFLLAEHGGEIVGSIECGPANDLLVACAKNELQDVPEVGTVFVHPHHQRRGLASLLLSTMFDALWRRNVKEVCLDSGYKEAQRIWTHVFGEPTYLAKDYWGDGSHHMVWHIPLKEALGRFSSRCDSVILDKMGIQLAVQD